MPPWQELSPTAAIYAIGNGETPVPELPVEYSQEARDFVKLCLVRDADQRPSAKQLLEHGFLKCSEQILGKKSVKPSSQGSDNNRPYSSGEANVRLIDDTNIICSLC